MKILLTGCNGMLGSSLSEKLSKVNYTTWATGKTACRLPSHFFHENFIYHNLDITNSLQTAALVNSFKPDLIIHAAAMTQIDDCEQNKDLCYSINVDGTNNLITAAKEVNARFCLISTDFVFSGDEGPYSETAPTRPVNYYGETKVLAEKLVSSSGLNWSIARTILLYGKADPSKRSNFIYWVKNNLEAGVKIKVVNDQIRTPTFIPDLVEGIYLIAEKDADGIFHISGKDILTPFKMALEIADFLNLDKNLLEPVDASTFSQIGKRPQKTGFKIEKAIEELGYQPTSFKNALSMIF